jgi:hypothetical protein
MTELLMYSMLFIDLRIFFLREARRSERFLDNLTFTCIYMIRMTIRHDYGWSYFWILSTVTCLLQKFEYKTSGPGSIPALRQNNNGGIWSVGPEGQSCSKPLNLSDPTEHA